MTAAHAIDALERRRAPRVDTSLRAVVRVGSDHEGRIVRGLVYDLSEVGANVRLNRKVPVGAQVMLDLECELPLRVFLGFDSEALVIDGPMHTHLVSVVGTVVRRERLAPRRYDVGVEFCPVTTSPDALTIVCSYLDDLR